MAGWRGLPQIIPIITPLFADLSRATFSARAKSQRLLKGERNPLPPKTAFSRGRNRQNKIGSNLAVYKTDSNVFKYNSQVLTSRAGIMARETWKEDLRKYFENIKVIEKCKAETISHFDQFASLSLNPRLK